MKMHRKTRMALALVSALAAAVPASAFAIPGSVCSDTPVTARGEPASYLWTAKIKARANWRRKVRVLPTFGPAWANWYRATDTEERCLSGPESTVCIFTGTPCKQ